MTDSKSHTVPSDQAAPISSAQLCSAIDESFLFVVLFRVLQVGQCELLLSCMYFFFLSLSACLTVVLRVFQKVYVF